MTGISVLLVYSGISTGLGVGLAVWGLRTRRTAAAFLGAGILLQGIALLGFYLVWTFDPFDP